MDDVKAGLFDGIADLVQQFLVVLADAAHDRDKLAVLDLLERVRARAHVNVPLVYQLDEHLPFELVRLDDRLQLVLDLMGWRRFDDVRCEPSDSRA